jgi:hypothetical protein
VPQPNWTYLIPLAVAGTAFTGVVIGVIAQQVVDIWKTSKMHRQELHGRIFDVKFKAATEVSVILYTAAGFLRAQLAEADEWTRGDTRYDVLALRRYTLDIQGQALRRAFEDSERAFALMEFLFPPSVWLHQRDGAFGSELEESWREFEEARSVFKTKLDQMMPDERAAELNRQRQRGVLGPEVDEELQRWVRFYEAGISELRNALPKLHLLTNRFDVATHKAIEVLREEFRHYER